MKILTILCTSLLLISCTKQTNNVFPQEEGRFEVLEEFKFFDEGKYETGEIIKDKETSQCYLLYSGWKKAAMVKVDCETQR